MTVRNVAQPSLAAALAGFVAGAAALAGSALLIVPGPGALAAVGLVAFIAFAAAGAGVWVGGRDGASPPWIAVVVALVAASVFAEIWEVAVTFRGTGFGRALGVLLFLAEPCYLLGSALAAVVAATRPLERPRTAGIALAGAALGVLLASVYLVPRLPAGALFMGAAALMALTGWRQTRPLQARRREGVQGTTILITGVGGRGQLGFAIAELLVERGARVMLADLSDEVAQHVRSLGEERSAAVTADLATEQGAASVVHAAMDRFGALDGVVNAAGGLSVTRRLEETDLTAWDQEYRRNATTAHLVSRAALPALRRTRGAIVNFASPIALRGAAKSLGAYAAAKSAVVALTRTLALEERDHGVRVNAIAPGMIDTEQNRASVEDPSTVRWVRREDVARVVAFLLSDEARGVTGEVVRVEGV